MMIKAAILGATGYTGVELVRLLSAHPAVEMSCLISGSSAGTAYSEVHPQFYGRVDLELQELNVKQVATLADVAFCALPHGQSALAVSELYKEGLKVIDLSADYRLKDHTLYPTWYNLEHPVAELLSEAVYGLPELYKEKIKSAKILANPGCYPTSIILALAPLLSGKIIKPGSIIIDAKSGVSGAGRAPKQPFHFPDCTENFKAYKVASHQHTAEIEQELGRLAGEKLQVTFTPHLVPMVRGILSTIYVEAAVDTNQAELEDMLESFYSSCPFVRVLKAPALPETRMVRGSNFCDIAVKYDKRTKRIIILVVIDNLLKGASGQAVQNMNIMYGLEEHTGLNQIAL
jgi:N-acetyl-gamma-glutamyl-phosphate reductase